MIRPGEFTRKDCIAAVSDERWAILLAAVREKSFCPEASSFDDILETIDDFVESF